MHLINAQLIRLNLSARWLADKLHVSNVALSKWLAGKSHPRNANAWNQMLEVLADYERQVKYGPRSSVQRVGMKEIFVGAPIQAGAMSSSDSDVFTIEVKDWGTDRERWGRTVQGYSMAPDLIPGDIAIFEDRPWEPYHVVHAFDQGEDTIKVARKIGAKVELVPINPDYDVIDGKNANIKGVLVMRIRKGPEDISEEIHYPHGMRYRILPK